ncbi:allantoate amidohydrolase [Oharaeibacter diazotrophicus]|uniref:N-carbamoyl-L-amino-acid hydrolase n=1 Tax=Oharaeibacter diazotrophicus TaxID=1920512 RepID=A0A4R6RCS5_9HYPH|nr:allantoate amidohydrolase [Oharaeibacter diazotrophicus]TDP83507.1 N-carbamoyl-L-amino-acid hydrolase [Oharaeibacter diazotrophicus]BBE72340.1 putative hydrolase/MSMEI_3903 [Pleomorphomonas sp. SM30]GLS79110.1 Zn-dependent hydrolase [Oharaeibacter diazotrophicus]
MSDLHGLIDAFAAFGDSGDGGVRRLTGTTEDAAARALLAAEFRRRGFALAVDGIGNMFGRAGLAPEAAEVVLTGSHLDSQPTGGRYDGTYGVIAATLAADALRARAAANPDAVRRDVVVVNWTNEEGARFQPSLTGSSVFTGALPLDTARDLRDGAGVALGAALDAIGWTGDAAPAFDIARYVELHVEQGDRLERAGAAIGVVTACWAARKLSIVFQGAPSHTGPTPMPRRRDALRAAARAIEALHGLVADDPDTHVSAARISVEPNSPNVVPARVQVWFEVRHRDVARTAAIGDAFLAAAVAGAEPLGVAVEVAIDERRAAQIFDRDGTALVAAAARRLGLPAIDTETVAGHDAVALMRKMPSTLIFVPSRGGLSHCPEEYTAPADLDAGVAVLTEVLWDLVTAG